MSTLKSSAEHLTLNADGSGNDIKFQSNATEVAAIDQSGNLTLSGTVDGVDVAAAGALATNALPKAGGTMTGALVVSRDEGHIRAQSATTTAKNISMFYNNASDHGQINCDQSGVNQKNLWITGLNLQFGRNTSTEYFKIADSGNVTVTSGDLTIAGSGKGVYLGGTGSANHLDDYEEGTWTPAVQGAAGNPSSITFHTAPSGRYTKIGRQVTITFYLHINTATGGSGNFQLHGVPFTADSGNGGYSGAVSLYYADASLSDPVLKINSNFLSIICASGTGGYFSNVTWASAQLSAVATGTAMAGTLTYFV